MPLAMPAMAPEKELTAAGDQEVLHLANLGKDVDGRGVEEVLVRELVSRWEVRSVGMVVVVVVVGVVIVGGP